MTRLVGMWVVLAVACAGPEGVAQTAAGPQPSASEGVLQIEVAGLRAALAASAVLIDVRTPEEYAAGHVPGARNVPLDLLSTRLDEIGPAGTPVYVICQSGRRSLAASQQLAAAGRKPVNVLGGTAAWKAAGFPTE
ncbi:MAG: hypothetical protein RLZZ383_3056 [Pseudomonadota bacterium]|jgi:rhodanese-related sulfurtransferase